MIIIVAAPLVGGLSPDLPPAPAVPGPRAGLGLRKARAPVNIIVILVILFLMIIRFA